MFDDQNGVAARNELLQHVDQLAHVVHVQAGGRLVQNIEGGACGAAGQLRGQLHPLGLAAGKRRGGLAQLDIAEADVHQRLDLIPQAGQVLEKLKRLVAGHFQHVGNAGALVVNLQRLAVIALALADVAGHVHVRQEVHFDLDQAVAAARLTAAALGVEGKAAWTVAPKLGVLRGGVEVPDVVEQAGIGGRIGARSAADGALVDADHLVELFDPLKAIMPTGTNAGVVQATRQLLVDDLIDQRGLAGAGHARHAAKRPKRDAHVHVLQVILPAAVDPQRLSAARTAKRRNGNGFLPGEILARDGARHGLQVRDGALGDDLAAVDARAGADVHDIVRRSHGVLVMLDHDQRIADVTQALQRFQQLVVVALVQTDRRLVENVKDAHQT